MLSVDGEFGEVLGLLGIGKPSKDPNWKLRRFGGHVLLLQPPDDYAINPATQF